MKLVEIFQELAMTNSIREKEKLIAEYKDDEQFVELLYRNLNPNQLFQFSEMPVKGNITVSPVSSIKDNYESFINCLDKLYTREVTGHAARDLVLSTFDNFDEEEYVLYSKILLKGPIGVTATTVNKVIPNLVPDFKLMLAPNKQADITKLSYPRIVQPKLDGYRAIHKEGIFISRTGKPFGNSRIARFFEQLKSINDYVFDGEMYAHGIGFNKLQTILNTHDGPLPYSLKYVVYDCIPLKDWEKQSCNIPYEERLKKARELINTYIANYKKIVDISSDLVHSSKEVVELYKEYLANGYEGAMIKDPNGKYYWKRVTVRNGAMLKLKPFKSVDLKVTGFYDGEGRNEGKAGGFVVDYNGVPVRVGTGLTDSLRDEVAKNPASYLGKTIEVKYLEETEDKSLRHPVFTRFREEKD
jgi:DNA ligase 1